MKVNRLKLPVGVFPRKVCGFYLRKKTTRCTPLEILGRIAELVDDSTLSKEECYDAIEELLQEWRHS